MNGNFCRKCGEKLATLNASVTKKGKTLTAAEYLYKSSPMDLGDAISTCFKKYAVFEGRASRSEFWLFALFNIIVYMVWIVLIFLLSSGSTQPIVVFLFYLPFLVLLLPNLAVTIRRLHDAGYSGGFYFLFLIPFVGTIFYLIFMLQPTSDTSKHA
jgi:uncharacterized membrane protein YhaH (DUF805 family)